MEGQMLFGGDGDFDPIKVGIGQFYGIEINDFAVTVAKTALWIAEAQMMHETETIIGKEIDFLPLKSYANITEGNSLRIDWESVVPKEKLSYIMGNPPFVGARLMGQEQKDDVFAIFDGVKNNGNLDYVACWYKKAADLMTGTAIRTALVSTNSITQGEQVAILWKTLFEQGVHIDFAHRTFRWDSESNSKAQVHCVIVGFSLINHNSPKKIYDNGAEKIVKNINGYLVEADDVIIESRSKPISDVPLIGMGNQPIDDGNYLFTSEEKDNFILCEPQSEQFFHPWMGAKEFINGSFRYCLWLGECSPRQLRSIKYAGGAKMSNTDQFDWVSFYKEFASKLLLLRQDRIELVTNVLKIYEVTGINLPTLEKDNKLVDIDPFTVFGLFNKSSMKESNRIKIISAIADIFDVSAPVPTSFDSIPVLNNQNATFYYFIGDREERDIDDLWELFESALSYASAPTADNRATLSKYFDLVINKKGNGNSKITMGLYWIAPNSFLNLDQRNTWYIYESGKIPADVVGTLPEIEAKIPSVKYFDIVEKLRAFLQSDRCDLKDFKELSFEAWKYSEYVNQQKKAETETKQSVSNASIIKWFKPVIDALKALGGSGTPEQV